MGTLSDASSRYALAFIAMVLRVDPVPANSTTRSRDSPFNAPPCVPFGLQCRDLGVTPSANQRYVGSVSERALHTAF